MLDGLTIRKSAKKCEITVSTAFIWRHKVLDALQEMQSEVKLDGIVETDETFFALSFKGNHEKSIKFVMPRKAHKRGKQVHLRGLSREQVCVPCSVNGNGLSVARISNLGKVEINDDYSKYIDSCIVMLSPDWSEKIKCGICSFDNNLVVSFGTILKNNEFENKFKDILSLKKIRFLIKGNGINLVTK